MGGGWRWAVRRRLSGHVLVMQHANTYGDVYRDSDGKIVVFKTRAEADIASWMLNAKIFSGRSQIAVAIAMLGGTSKHDA